MIDCFQRGGLDKNLEIWLYCEICAYPKLISEFSNMIIECNSFEICNDCDKDLTKKSKKEGIVITNFRNGRKV